jgi:hypothetical protein
MLPISSDEDLYVSSCVRVPARVLPHARLGAALVSLLAPSSAITFTSREETDSGPPPAQAPHST